VRKRIVEAAGLCPGAEAARGALLRKRILDAAGLCPGAKTVDVYVSPALPRTAAEGNPPADRTALVAGKVA
jgi:hypothetical protein